MSISTFVLGLGGTGVLTLRHLKKLYHEMPEDQRVETEFLAIDFDRSALMMVDRRLADLEDEQFLYLQPEKLQETARNMDRMLEDEPAWKRVLDWYPDRTEVQIPVGDVEANGAGQYRVLGRLGFFLNDDLIESEIRNGLDRLQTKVDIKRLSKQKRVMLVASTAGGTGAGMFIDAAYICRRQESNPRVFAYLLLPEVFHDVDHGGRIFQNSYATLRELAHLKDQIIPFSARYYEIPPVEVDAGGEEPFARLFLFGRAAAIGEDQILATTHQMAQTILGQLHCEIQEKTLAVVNNTVSSTTAAERYRRRTHAFSSAGSRYLDLAGVKIPRDAPMREVVRILQSDQELAGLYGGELPAALASLQRKVSIRKDEEPGPAAPGEDVLPDQQAEDLAKRWHERMERAASLGADALVEHLGKRVEELKNKSSHRWRTDEQKAANEEIGDLGELLLTPFDEENYERNLEVLRKLSKFPAVDSDIEDQIRTLVYQTPHTLKPGETVQRRALYGKLKEWIDKFWVDFPTPSSAEITELKTEWDYYSTKEKSSESLSRWKRLVSLGHDRQSILVAKCLALQKALEAAGIKKHLGAILLVRAFKKLKTIIDSELENLDQRMQEIRRPFLEIRFEESVAEGKTELPPAVRDRLRDRIRRHLPEILERAAAEAQEKEKGSVSEQRLFELIRARLGNDEFLDAQFMIPVDKEQSYQDSLLEHFLRARQEIFLRRTPNPQRKGFAVILLPEGILWPEGSDKLKSFVRSSAQQILDCRTQVVPHRGDRIWIYTEDLFNPPEHIRNLDDYYGFYKQEEHRELFHIDRRFLQEPNFKEIVSASSTFVVNCGNSDCRYNIGDLPRTERICPSCHRLIRSRCGNKDCTEDALHRHPKRADKQCPACNGFNHAAWWICDKHGKTPVEIPIDKARCRKCIREHLENPIEFPAHCISRRPDLETSVPCPHCAFLEATDPSHETFFIREDLLPFYCDGVNGHAREKFAEVARKYKLPDSFRCPSCRTVLIPIHHREARRVRRRSRPRCSREEVCP